MFGDLRQLRFESIDHSVVLRVNRIRVGLVVDRMQQCLHSPCKRVVPPATTLQGRCHALKYYVQGGHQLHPGQARGDQSAEEAQRAGAVLDGGDIEAQDFAVAVGVDTDRDQGVDVDDAAVLAVLRPRALVATNV